MRGCNVVQLMPLAAPLACPVVVSMRRPIGRVSHLVGRYESCMYSAIFCTCCSACAGVFQRISSLARPLTSTCCVPPMAYQRFVILLRLQSKPRLRLWLPKWLAFARPATQLLTKRRRSLPVYSCPPLVRENREAGFERGRIVPMMGRLAWVKWIAQNRRTIFKLVKHGSALGAEHCRGIPTA